MNKEKYVFSQLVSFLDRNHFNYLVRKYYMLKRGIGYERPVNENFLKIFLQKVLVVRKFALPLHPLSKREP